MAVPLFVRKILRFSFEPCGYRCILVSARRERERKENTMKDAKEKALFRAMVDAVTDYKEHNEVHSTSDGRYEKAQMATTAYADYCGISYKLACSIVREMFINPRDLVKDL